MTSNTATQTKKTNIFNKLKNRPKNKNRIWELDFLRGVSIVLMCLDHMFYDVVAIFQNWAKSDNAFLRSFFHAGARYLGVSNDKVLLPENVMQICDYVFLWIILLAITLSFVILIIKKTATADNKKNYCYAVGIAVISLVAMIIDNNTIGFSIESLDNGCTARDFIHPIILWFFFLICGLSCRFSRSNIKRTIEIAVCAGLISLFTYLAEIVLDTDGMFVCYGVLHMLATAVFIYTLIEIVCKLIFKDENKRKWAISIACLVLAIVLYTLNQYLWSVSETLPEINGLQWFHWVFGELDSADWFTIGGYAYMIFFGAALSPFLYPKKESLFPQLNIVNKGFFTFMGRHTLIVVLVHQPLIYGILSLVNLLD